MSAERVQKILAQAGIASRRKAEELIQEGLVTINGKLAQLGDKAEWGKDAIKVKGKLLGKPEAPLYLAFYKPKAVISTLEDPDHRTTLSDFLSKIEGRVFPIGRLDFNSEGLLLLTNDGEFAQQVQKHSEIVRTYSVKVKGHPDLEMLERLKRGTWIGEGSRRQIKPHSVRMKQELNNKSIVEVVVQGGGAFDMKSLFETKGFLVEKIVRTSIGHITLKGLAPGHYRFLKASQAFALLEQPELGIQQIEPAAPAPRKPMQLPQPLSKTKTRPGKPVVIQPLRKPLRKPARGNSSAGGSTQRPSIRPKTKSSGKPSIRPAAKLSGRPIIKPKKSSQPKPVRRQRR